MTNDIHSPGARRSPWPVADGSFVGRSFVDRPAAESLAADIVNEAGARPCTATRAAILESASQVCPGLSRKQIRDLFETVLDEISDTLTRGESVRLRSFGHFAVRSKRERIGRNPRTGAEAPIKPRRVLTFRPSPVLVDRVNGRAADENAGMPAAPR